MEQGSSAVITFRYVTKYASKRGQNHGVSRRDCQHGRQYEENSRALKGPLAESPNVREKGRWKRQPVNEGL